MTVAPLAAALAEDSTLAFSAHVRGTDGSTLAERVVVWSSSDAAVARVTAGGEVTAVAAGQARITASVEGIAGSAEVTVHPRPVAAIEVTPPAAELRVRGTLQLAARLLDDRGRVLSGREIRWESSDAAIAGVDAQGMVTALAPGNAFVRALVEGQRDSARIVVTPGEAARLEIVGGDGQAGVVGSTLADSPTVRLTDADGNPIAGAAITWTAVNGGSASPPIAETDVAGIARATWTLGTVAGAQSVTASGAGLAATFAATATPGQPAMIALHAGDGQSGPAGAALPDSLVVRVTDAHNNPVQGAAVTWAAGGGAVSPATTLTDAAGLARARWTLGAAGGEQVATATLAGVGSITFRSLALRAPEVQTLAAAQVGEHGALLRGSVHPHALATTAWFEWGESETLADARPTPPQEIGAGAAPVEVSSTLAELSRGTTYYFRSAAESEGGTTRGQIRSFTTQAPAPPAGVRIVTFGDSNTDSGYEGRSTPPRVRSYVSVMPERLGPNDPNSPFQLAGKTEARWAAVRATPLAAVNHGISATTTGGGVGGGTNRSSAGAPHARTVVNGVTRFEAEALGTGYPWHGGEPTGAAFPDGPVTRVQAFVPGEHDFLYISLGTNDAGQGVTTAQTLANLEWMIDRWLAAGRRVEQLILTTLPPRTSGSGATIPQINDGIRALANARGVHLIDLAEHTSANNGVSWRSAQLHVGDGIHYAESVRDWLAERVVEYLLAHVPE